jgi:hypothetical protein
MEDQMIEFVLAYTNQEGDVIDGPTIAINPRSVIMVREAGDGSTRIFMQHGHDLVIRQDYSTVVRALQQWLID